MNSPPICFEHSTPQAPMKRSARSGYAGKQTFEDGAIGHLLSSVTVSFGRLTRAVLFRGARHLSW